ncbi:MAG: DUF4091 domain-containing protein [Clostridiaceae bacterium]|nr:DUF4091 domain-containing protein [Clostridiaceae bacterium]
MSISAKLVHDAYKLTLNYHIPPDASLPASLAAAKNDTVSFQILLQADQRYCVNIGQSAWFSEKGPLLCIRPEISAFCPVSLNIEGFVVDDDDTRKADVLLSEPIVEAAANMPTAIWVELHIPKDAPVGPAKVSVRVFTSTHYQDELLAETLEINLNILDYILPDSKDFSFYLDLWQHNSNIARKHEVALWSDRHFAIMESYVRSLAELGQKSITIIASEVPWRGQSCFANQRNPSNLFEFSIIGITRASDGHFIYDYTAMQRYIDLCGAYGIAGDIEVFGLVNVNRHPDFDTAVLCADYPEPILLRYYDTQDHKYHYMSHARDIEDYITSLEQYFIRTHQISQVRIAADEPGDMAKYRESLCKIKTIAPHFIFKTAINHAEFIKEFKDSINDFAPFIHCLCTEYETLKTFQEQLPDKKFLWYVCCGPDHFNTFIRSHLLESRFIGIFTSLIGFDGFLRWNYTVWPDNPRADIRYGSFPAGDTNFVYPSASGGVLLSLRYKQLQKGIVDFELLARLRAAGQDALVRRVYNLLVKNQQVVDYFQPDLLPVEQICSLDYADYNQARALMLAGLVEK